MSFCFLFLLRVYNVLFFTKCFFLQSLNGSIGNSMLCFQIFEYLFFQCCSCASRNLHLALFHFKHGFYTSGIKYVRWRTRTNIVSRRIFGMTWHHEVGEILLWMEMSPASLPELPKPSSTLRNVRQTNILEPLF